jgi:leucyl aminopeptidase
VALEVTISAAAPANSGAAFLALAIDDSLSIHESIAEVDRASGGGIRQAIEAREFRGARDEVLHITSANGTPRRIVLIGTGKSPDRSGALRRAAAIAARQAVKLGTGAVAFFAPDLSERDVESVTMGLNAGAWEYRELKSPPPEIERRAPLVRATVLAADNEASRRGLSTGIAIGAGHGLARRLAMMPGNLCTPEYLANTATEIASRHGMDVTVLGRTEMQAEGMGALLSVAQGTPQDPKLIALVYHGGSEGSKPVVLVGKGLCFDSGGISIKPAQSMEDMKYDMCGAAGVLGALDAIGRMRLPINVVGLIGSTTNMPSGTAVNPGDVVRSHLGKYIEIINTDAEGRLVLADVLSYARRFEPAVVVDAATLTGACVIALGHTATGVFGLDDALVAEVIAAGKRAGEPGWSLPLWDEYRDLIKSEVADIKNSGGRPAGAVTAAMFLKEFTESYPWVHLDIAGTAYSENDLVAIPKGPTGVPVGTFVEFVRGRVS